MFFYFLTCSWLNHIVEPGATGSWRDRAIVYAVNPKKAGGAGHEAAKPLQILCLTIQEIEGKSQEPSTWTSRTEQRDLSSTPDQVTEWP